LIKPDVVAEAAGRVPLNPLFDEQSTTPLKAELISQSRRPVLVVDDDLSMLRSMARLLRHLGYDNVLFPSAEAFAKHTDFGNAVCVLLDINFGAVSGIDLRNRLRAANVSVPVIYMTGNDSPVVRERALQSGCLDYLLKPISTASLVAALKRASLQTDQKP
jgi:FixJ family two-component response regulator